MVIACIDDEIDLCGALRSLDCLEHGVDSEVTSGLTLSEIRQIGVDLDVGNGHLSSGCPIEDPADMLITLVTHDSGGSDHRAHIGPGIGDLLEAILIGAMVIACIDDEIDLCSALGRLGLAIDGIEGQIALLVVIVPAVFLGYQRSQRVEVIRSAIQGTIYRIEFPSGDGLITVLDRRSRTFSGGNCLRGSNWGLIIRSAEADLNRIPLIRRRFGGGCNVYSNPLSNIRLCGIGVKTIIVYVYFKVINRGTVDRYTGDFIAVSRLKNHRFGIFTLFDILIPVLYSAAVINGANYRVGSCAALQSFGQPNFDDYVYTCTADCFKSQIATRNRYVERCIPNLSSQSDSLNILYRNILVPIGL